MCARRDEDDRPCLRNDLHSVEHCVFPGTPEADKLIHRRVVERMQGLTNHEADVLGDSEET